jgi:hypothetical protein
MLLWPGVGKVHNRRGGDAKGEAARGPGVLRWPKKRGELFKER